MLVRSDLERHVTPLVTTMALRLELGTPGAQRVQDAVHKVLVAHDMSASDDVVMAEYVTVMIANHKGRDAIAEELGELVGGELDARVATEIWEAANATEAQNAPQERQRSASPDAMQEERYVERPQGASRERPLREDRERPLRADRERPRQDRKAQNARRRDQELFPSKPRGRMHADTIQEPLSIFGRAGVPDPHAPPFVPENMPPPPPEFMAMMAAMGAPSLFARLDPMMPNNPAVDTKAHANAAHAALRDPSTFPTAPSQAALCRYSIHCTNPQCVYSHPSPANAGKNGDESALVLREDACVDGAACKDKECVKSHVSPAVALLPSKPPAPSACRFQDKCLNPQCAFSHYDANGHAMPPPAAQPVACRFGTRCTRPDCHYTHPTKSKTPCRYGDECTRPDCIFTHPRDGPARPTADRLKAFAETSDEMERILPGEQPDGDAPIEA